MIYLITILAKKQEAPLNACAVQIQAGGAKRRSYFGFRFI
jgi:hypothetical protein